MSVRQCLHCSVTLQLFFLSVCVFDDVWLCQGGELRGTRDLFKSAKQNPVQERVCVCMRVSLAVDQAMWESRSILG